jgi:hypothetical protein
MGKPKLWSKMLLNNKNIDSLEDKDQIFNKDAAAHRKQRDPFLPRKRPDFWIQMLMHIKGNKNLSLPTEKSSYFKQRCFRKQKNNKGLFLLRTKFNIK